MNGGLKMVNTKRVENLKNKLLSSIYSISSERDQLITDSGLCQLFGGSFL